MTTNPGLPNDKSITVADYSWQFFERVKQQKYGDTEEENSLVAGQNFYGLLSKLQDTGSKDDVKVPLRVLRDEIGRVYFKSTTHRETSTIETLFKLYDSVEAECQRVLHSKPEQKEAAASTHLLEELRLRFSRLAVGDTWEAYPELKLKALKRMQSYAVKEREGKQATATTPTNSTGDNLAGAWPGKQRKSMKRMMSIGGGGGAAAAGGVFSAWQSTIDDLAKAPGARLFPFVKLLLQEAVEGQIAVPARPSDGPAPEPSRAESEALAPAPSGVADAGVTTADTGNRLAELNLDDLLGLSDATPTTAASEQPAPQDAAVGRTSDDPFAQKQAPQQQQPAGGTAPGYQQQQGQQQQRPDASNPFGSASFTSQGSQQPGGPTTNGTGQQPYNQGYNQGYGQPHAPQGQYGSGQQTQGGYSQGAYIQGQYTPAGYGQAPQGQGHHGQQDYAPQQQQHLQQQGSSGSYGTPTYQQPSYAQQQYAPQPHPQSQPRQQQYAPPHHPGIPPQGSQSFSSQHSGHLPPHAPQPYSPSLTANPSNLSSPGGAGPASSQDLGPPRGSGFSLGSAPSATQSDYQNFASPLGRAPSNNPAEPASSPYSSAPGRGQPGGYSSQLGYGQKSGHLSGQYSGGHSQPQSPAVSQPTSSFSPTAPQSIHSGGGSSGFGSGAFGGGGFEQSSLQAGAGQAVSSPGAPASQQGAGNGFNPFGLQDGSQQQQQAQHLQPQSSLTYAGSQPLPPFSDNRFSDVGPVVPPAQQHNIPQPMRAPPAPPSSSGTNQYSAW